jgi:hypothetical protein
VPLVRIGRCLGERIRRPSRRGARPADSSQGKGGAGAKVCASHAACRILTRLDGASGEAAAASARRHLHERYRGGNVHMSRSGPRRRLSGPCLGERDCSIQRRHEADRGSSSRP